MRLDPRLCKLIFAGNASLMVVLRRGMLVLLAAALPALAAVDIPNAKDHPLLTRYPNSHITEYEKAFNAVEMAIGKKGSEPVRKAIEGDATIIHYFHNNADKQPSALQLIRNYQNAIKGIGGEVVYERLPREGDGGETTLKVTTGGKEVWVRVEPGIFSAPTQSYKLWIVEVAGMQQLVTANKLLDELNKNGFVALYINFDTGKWDLKADGQATVREIVTMLKSARALKIAVEGHTDSVGQAAANKTLSENRAKAVMAAIVAGGIDPKRLSAAGFGQERPVADNRNDEGRAKNRRVELVKK
ncbi:MAG: OmpA family protein [Burkholderiales bacterium]|nr:OmpA family protein [Burkholderiales bacterium]